MNYKRTVYTYQDGKLASCVVYDSASDNVLFSYVYTYGANGKLASMVRSSADGIIRYAYSYDSANRLTQVLRTVE